MLYTLKSILNTTKNIKFQISLGFAIVLFFFKLFAGSGGTLAVTTVNEVLVLLTVASFILYLLDFSASLKVTPLSLVMNIGILNAILFVLITFSGTIINGLFDHVETRAAKPDLIFLMISYFYVFIIICSAAYIFIALKELFFLKQKKNVNTYFNTMVIFFFLTSISTLLNPFDGLAYIRTTFLIISIILIVINSIKISWIAFIVKKEKISLLVLSVVISVLFIVNLVNNSDASTHHQVLSGFSTSLSQFVNLLMIYGVIYFSILFFTTLFHLPTADAFDRKAQEVSSLQYFSKLITNVFDLNDLAETGADIAVKICNADSAWIIWKEEGKKKTAAVKNTGVTDAEYLTKYVFERENEESVTGTVVVNVSRAAELSSKYSYVAVSPLKTHNTVRGWLFIAKKNDFIFDEEDKKAIEAFSDYASIAIENSLLLKESIEKERLEKELDVAREVQRKILPQKNPVHEKLNISSLFIPAFEVGGDYYDFFDTGEDELGFIIADVSGKGITAAFIMAEIKGIFESLSKTIKQPKEILIKANQILYRTLDRKSFVSAAYGVIDLKKEVLHLARAGHCPIILVRDGKAINMQPRGIGLGLNFSSYFADTLEEITIELKENDVIVLYTDGITEAKNYELEDFGSNLFEQILVQNSNRTVDQIANSVIREVTLFSQDSQQHDDITLVVLKWKQNNKTNGNLNGEKEWQNLTHQLQM